MTYRLAELDGVPPPSPNDEARVDTDALVADLVETRAGRDPRAARRGRRALYATSWLRSKAACQREP